MKRRGFLKLLLGSAASVALFGKEAAALSGRSDDTKNVTMSTDSIESTRFIVSRTDDDLLDAIVSMRKELDEANVPSTGRVIRYWDKDYKAYVSKFSETTS